MSANSTPFFLAAEQNEMEGADGSIWKGDLSTGEGEVVLSPKNAGATGLEYDRRTDYLFVAGASAGDK